MPFLTSVIRTAPETHKCPQELLLLLDEYWEQHPELKSVPIYQVCVPFSYIRLVTWNGCTQSPITYK